MKSLLTKIQKIEKVKILIYCLPSTTHEYITFAQKLKECLVEKKKSQRKLKSLKIP